MSQQDCFVRMRLKQVCGSEDATGMSCTVQAAQVVIEAVWQSHRTIS